MSIQRIQKTLDYLYRTCGTFNCPPDFKALVICDLHLGIGDKADDFEADKPLCDLLKWLWNWLGFLIVLGDLFDLWENKDLTKIMSAHPDVVVWFQRFHQAKRIIRLCGNHDDSQPYPDALKLLFPSGKIIFIAHGHRGSWACDRGSWFGKAFVRYIWAGIGQRVFDLPDPTSARVSINPGKHEEVRQAYNGWANDRKITTLWGHTHYTEQVGYSFNSGTWIGQHREGIEILGETINLKDFS